MRLLLQDGNRTDVEREAGRLLEGPDPALAQHDLRVPFADNVLGGHQQLFDRGRWAALQKYRLLGSADLGEEREVLHVPRADLDDVGGLDHRLDMPRVHELGDDRKSGLLPGLDEDVETLLPEPLEGVWRRARLERAAAQHRRSGPLNRAGGRERLLAVFDGARAGDQPEVAVPDPAPAGRDDGRFR